MSGFHSEAALYEQVLRGFDCRVMAQAVASRLHCGCEHPLDLMVPLIRTAPKNAVMGGKLRVSARCPGCKQVVTFYSKDATGAEILEILAQVSQKLAGVDRAQDLEECTIEGGNHEEQRIY